MVLNASMACPSILNMTVNWIQLIPFLFLSLEQNNTVLVGYLPVYMKIASAKCGCPMMHFNFQRMNISSSEELEIKIRRSNRSTAPELYFPVFANHNQLIQYQRPFLPLFRSPGPAVIERKLGVWKETNSLISMILKTWPILCLCLLFGLLAGFAVWAIVSIFCVSSISNHLSSMSFFIAFMQEHRKNPEDFPATFPHGALAGIWWSFVTMTTVGYGDKTARTLWGRMFGVFWMLFGIIVMSMFTGQITANITSSKMATVDLMDTKVAVPKGMKTFIEQEMNLGARDIVDMTYDEMEAEIPSEKMAIEYFIIHDYSMARKWLSSAKDVKIVKIIDRRFDIGMTITGNYESVESFLTCLQRDVIDFFQISLAMEKLNKTSDSSSSNNKQETNLASVHILLMVSGGALVLCVLLGFLLKCSRVRTRKSLRPSDLEHGQSRPPFVTELAAFVKPVA